MTAFDLNHRRVSDNAVRRGVHPEESVARDLAMIYQELARYDRDAETWRLWNGDTHWRGPGEFANEGVYNLIRIHCQMLVARTAGISASDIRRLLSNRQCGNVEAFMRRSLDLVTAAPFWDADPFLLGTPDGTVDLRTGDIRQADPGDYISKLTRVTAAPKGAVAPRWNRFMAEVTDGDRELQRFLRQWAGVSASGTSRDQRFVFIHGPGANGKGVFLRVISRLLGPYHTMADPELLIARRTGATPHPTGLAKIMQARMVSATEVPPGATWNTALLKLITGGDDVTARFMYKDFVDFTPRCSITISGNDKPALEGVDHAIRRRFILTEFPVIFRNPIADLDEQLVETEGPAILRWIIDGAVDREQTGSLLMPESARRASEEYFNEEDLIPRFLAERCERDGRSPAEQEADPWRVGSTELFENWKSFTLAIGRRPGSHTTFTLKVRACGISDEKTNRGRFFKELRLRTQW